MYMGVSGYLWVCACTLCFFLILLACVVFATTLLFHMCVQTDDFGDNGEALLSARVRVMPTSFFVLMRMFVRVDGVLMRVIDTRVYHRYGIHVCSVLNQSTFECMVFHLHTPRPYYRWSFSHQTDGEAPCLFYHVVPETRYPHNCFPGLRSSESN